MIFMMFMISEIHPFLDGNGRLARVMMNAELVKMNDVMQGFEKFESILIDRRLKIQIDDSVIRVKKKYPEIDGVQSRILRTAILQRLL